MRLAVLLAIAGCVLLAQSGSPILLEGKVTDASGKPIPGAQIAHISDSFDRSAYVETDASGRFSSQTSRPAMVIRKLGYVSRFFRTDSPLPEPIVLETAQPRPVCEPVTIPGMKEVFEQTTEYTAASETITTADGPRSLTNRRGPFWMYWQPINELVWTSVEYKEVMYASYILDAQGRTAEGRYWRYFGKIGESSQYQDVDKAAAEIFNLKMDGDCSKKPQP